MRKSKSTSPHGVPVEKLRSSGSSSLSASSKGVSPKSKRQQRVLPSPIKGRRSKEAKVVPVVATEEESEDEQMQVEDNDGSNKVPQEDEDLSSQEDLTEEDEGETDGLGCSRTSSAVGGGGLRHPLSPYQPLSAFQAPLRPLCQDNYDNDKMLGTGKKAKRMAQNKPGILYLSSIPPGYNVSRTTGFFAQFGQVGRVFLQPDEKEKEKSKDGLARRFTEGWIEFMSKRVAKEVADNLNNTQVGGKKRSKAHDVIWNIKYLSKFKWTHLSERLAYEKAVHQQRMRTEISQAKREADFFKMNVERSKRLKRKPQKEGQSQSGKSQRAYEFRQKETDDVICGNSGKEEEEEEGPSPTKRSKPGVQAKSKGKGKGGKGRKGGGGGGKEDRAAFLQSVFGAGD